jgi:hypothetical protein
MVKHIKIITLILLTSNAFGQKLDSLFIEYRRPLFDFDYNNPTLNFSDTQISNTRRTLHYYCLTSYREGVESVQGLINMGVHNDLKLGTLRCYWINATIPEIIMMSAMPTNVVLNVKDISKFIYKPEYGSHVEWKRKNAYCLELIMPAKTIDMDSIRNFCAQQFNISVVRDRRSTKIFRLCRISSQDLIKSKSKSCKGKFKVGVLCNRSIGYLIDAIANGTGIRLIDDTKYPFNVDMNLKIKSWTDIGLLRNALQKYGLDIIEDKIMEDVTIITENGIKV